MIAYENACAQFACLRAGLANGAIVVFEHPSASWLWTFPEASSLCSSAQRRSETFRPLPIGARVPPRPTDSPMLPKHFQCRTQLLTNGPAFKPLGLLCRRSMNTAKSGFLASSQNATWLTSEAFDRASPCKQRGTPILAWCAAGPRADRRDLGETSFWHDVQPCKCVWNQVGNLSCLHRSQRPSLPRRLYLRSTRRRDDLADFLRCPYCSKEWRRADAVQLMSPLRRHLTWAQARRVPAPTTDTSLACAKRLLNDQSLWSTESRHTFAFTTFFLRKLGTMPQRPW